MKISRPLLLALCSLFACKTSSDGSQSDTETLKDMSVSSSQPVTDFKLGFADKNKISYKVYKKIVSTTLEPNRNYIVQINFGKLSKSSYQLLQDHYGGQNLVPYSEGKSYELLDFLPPKMQALLNRWLIVTSQVDTRIPRSWINSSAPEVDRADVGMNCWSTAYEVIRELGKPFSALQGRFFFFGIVEAKEIFHNRTDLQESTQLLAKENWTKDEIVKRNQGRNPGDVLYVATTHAKFGPAHIAIWVDDDLYFEKTNYSSDDPIRLAFYEDVVSPYVIQDEPGQPVTLTFMRYKSPTKASFPTPESFAGKYPLPRDQNTDPLPPDAAKTLIFTRGVEYGELGSVGTYRIMNFKMGQDSKSARAIYVGADQLSNFLLNDTFCSSTKSYTTEYKYSYKISGSKELFVFDKQGKEVAKIKGQIINKTAGITTTISRYKSTVDQFDLTRTFGQYSIISKNGNEEVTLDCAE